MVETVNRVTSNEYKEPNVYEDVQYEVHEEQATQVIDIPHEAHTETQNQGTEQPKIQTQENTPVDNKQTTESKQMGMEW